MLSHPGDSNARCCRTATPPTTSAAAVPPPPRPAPTTMSPILRGSSLALPPTSRIAIGISTNATHPTSLRPPSTLHPPGSRPPPAPSQPASHLPPAHPLSSSRPPPDHHPPPPSAHPGPTHRPSRPPPATRPVPATARPTYPTPVPHPPASHTPCAMGRPPPAPDPLRRLPPSRPTPTDDFEPALHPGFWAFRTMGRSSRQQQNLPSHVQDCLSIQWGRVPKSTRLACWWLPSTAKEDGKAMATCVVQRTLHDVVGRSVEGDHLTQLQSHRKSDMVTVGNEVELHGVSKAE
jgi:hypothetical protein